MRAQFEDLNMQREDGFILCYKMLIPSFKFYWHYHSEFELTYILKRQGRGMVSDCIKRFSKSDLVLIGPSLSHTWVSNKIEK